jgi:hypothetical protein
MKQKTVEVGQYDLGVLLRVAKVSIKHLYPNNNGVPEDLKNAVERVSLVLELEKPCQNQGQ